MIGGVALAALALAAGNPPAASVEREVLIPAKVFTPQHEVVLVGDTVTWKNQDSSAHTVTADNLSFDSGNLPPGTSFSRTFSAAGVYVYHCAIHRYMKAEVDVFALALKAPGYAVPVGEQTALTGLAPPDVSEVTIREQDAAGRFTDVGTAPVAAGGSFRFPIVAEASGVYVAAAGPLTSGAATLSVAARLRLRVVRTARGITVRVRTSPAQPGARVQLQRYVFERFDFLPLRRARLDGEGRATFWLRPGAALHLRALLPTGVGGYGRAVSPTVLVRR